MSHLLVRSGVRALKTVTTASASIVLLGATLATPLLINNSAAADSLQPICQVNATAPSTAFPAAPINLAPSNNGTDASYFDFTWTAVSGADHYDWESSFSGDTTATGEFASQLSVEHVTGTAVNEGHSSSAVYFWHVRAVAADGTTSPWSSVWKVNIQRNSVNNLTAPILTAPADNTTCNIYSQDFDFTWDAPVSGNDGDLHYIFQSGVTASTDPVTGDFIDQPWTAYNLRTTSISDGNTSSGTYFWHVRAVADDGTLGPWSETRVVAIEHVAPVVTTPAEPTAPTDSTSDTNTAPTTVTAAPATSTSTPAIVTASSLTQLQPTTTDAAPATTSAVLDASTKHTTSLTLASNTVAVRTSWMTRNGIWLIASLLALIGSTTLFQTFQKVRVSK